MKQILSLLLVPCLFLAGCTKNESGGYNISITPAMAQTAATIATASALRFAVNDSNRPEVKKLVSGIAGTLYTVTGNPTPSELSKLINDQLPADLKAKYPEIIALVIPAVVSTYQMVYESHKSDVNKLYEYLKAMAAGVQSAAS